MLAQDDDSGSLDALKFSLASDIIELVVLTGDDAFLQTMRDAAGSARRLWHVPSGDKVSDLLVAGGVGIVVLDVQALIGPTKEFVTQIQRQFPDLVIVVAGNRDDETQLAGLISAGTIYRFIHKPMSPARARLFTEAAVRKFGEQRLRATQAPLQLRESNSSRGWLIGGALAAIAGIALFLWAQRPSAVEGVAVAPAAMPSATTSTEPMLLPRAAAAMAANRLTAPPGDNALELYLQAQARDPSDPQARAGVAEVHERLLAHVENALLKERFEEAAQAIETARQAGVENGRIAFFSAQLAKAHDQLKAAQPQLRIKNEFKAPEEPQPADVRKAVDRPEPEVAVKSVEDATDTVAQAADARNQLLNKAEERLQQDRLIEPANDNAKYYLAALRGVDADNPKLPAAYQDLGNRLVGKSQRALALGQLDAARSWLEESASIGFSSPESVSLQHQIDAASAQQRFLANIIPSAQLILLKTVKPTYPNKAAADKLQGWVELDFTVGESGEVRDIAVHASSSPGIFDEAAIKAVSQWRYQAILQNGKPVAERTRVRIRFADSGS